MDLRLGIEIDYVPGAEERMDNVATALPYDLGSERVVLLLVPMPPQT